MVHCIELESAQKEKSFAGVLKCQAFSPERRMNNRKIWKSSVTLVVIG